MVWPEYIDKAGDALLQDQPVTGFVKARFYIVAEKMREFHRQRVHPGIGFFCVEGPKVCAAGIVTQVTGLKGNRVSDEV